VRLYQVKISKGSGTFSDGGHSCEITETFFLVRERTGEKRDPLTQAEMEKLWERILAIFTHERLRVKLDPDSIGVVGHLLKLQDLNREAYMWESGQDLLWLPDIRFWYRRKPQSIWAVEAVSEGLVGKLLVAEDARPRDAGYYISVDITISFIDNPLLVT